MKLLSIIVPVYKAAAYIEHCVNSFYSQDMEENDFEVILVNDGSPDDSASIIQERLMPQHTNITLVHQENAGQGKARNLGLSYAKGKYILFVDSDDYLVEKTISKIIEIAESHQLDLCAFAMNVLDKHNQGSVYYQRQPLYQVFTGTEVIVNGLMFDSACTKLYLRESIVSAHISFKENMTHEDTEFNIQLFPHLKRVLFTDICAYVYCWNGESTDRSCDVKKVQRRYLGDIYVAKSLKQIALSTSESLLKRNYLKRSNSLMMNTLRLLLKDDLQPKSFVKQCFKIAKENELYPMRGKSLSLKSTLMMHLLNQAWLLKLMGYL